MVKKLPWRRPHIIFWSFISLREIHLAWPKRDSLVHFFLMKAGILLFILIPVLIAFRYNWISYSDDKAMNRPVGLAEYTDAQITIEWQIVVSLILFWQPFLLYGSHTQPDPRKGFWFFFSTNLICQPGQFLFIFFLSHILVSKRSQ